MALTRKHHARQLPISGQYREMTLRFPDEVDTKSLWAFIDAMGWTQYVASASGSPAEAASLPGRKKIKLSDEALQKARMLSVGAGYNVSPAEDARGAIATVKYQQR